MHLSALYAKTRLTAPAIVCLTIVACGGGGDTPPAPAAPAPAPAPEPIVTAFTVAQESGISYRHGYLTDPQDTEREKIEIQDFAGGVAAGDYDNDGDIDLLIVRGDIGSNLLYRNDGSGVFENVASSAGVANTKSATENYRHSGPTFADLDGDGDLDLFMGGILGDPSFIFRNNGDGTFTDVTAGAGIGGLQDNDSISAGFGDYDLDGDLDMFVAHWGADRIVNSGEDTESLWRNDTDNNGIRFTNVSVESGISATLVNGSSQLEDLDNNDYTFSPSFARINNDRYPDIVVAGDFNTSKVFINLGDGTFEDQTDPDVITDNNGMGSALGDYDNDGDLDWFVSAIYGPQVLNSWTGNRLYRNDGGVFTDVTETEGVTDGGWGWAACFMDFENDGDLDLYHTNGWKTFTFPTDPSRAFVSERSENTTGFTEQAADLGLDDTEQGRGVVCADFDNDGDVDIFQVHRNDTNAASLFRNDSTGNNYLTVKLNGSAPNTQAAGARIFATIGSTTQMREIIIGNNFTSQNPTEQVIGLGSASQVDELRVEWPDGTETIRTAVQAGQKLEIDQ